MSLLISDNHQETTVFHILYSPEVPIVLGHPWLVLSATEEPMELPDVPSEYLDLKAVFSKAKATCLSPHRLYDMTIEFLPGTFPPKGHLYCLSAPETEPMDTYIEEPSAAGIIHPLLLVLGFSLWKTRMECCNLA